MKRNIGRFRLGSILRHKSLLSEIPVREIIISLCRHLHGDWGNVSEQIKHSNEKALINGGPLLSAYQTRKKILFCVQTDAERKRTIVFCP